MLNRFAVFVAGALMLAPAVFAQTPSGDAQATIWRFDNIDSRRRPCHACARASVPDRFAEWQGRGFNGIDDALFIDEHPLAGASAYTWEVIFRPDVDGAEAQRFFHLSEIDPATGKDTDNRMLFEIRIVKGQWCLDSFAETNGSRRTLLNCDDLHPLGQWYRVTAVYDGKTLRNYVGDEMQGEGDLRMAPQGPGHSSIGTRINRRDFFKGAVFEARFTPRALEPGEFLKMPVSRAAKRPQNNENCHRD